jgi:hypothetical protein
MSGFLDFFLIIPEPLERFEIPGKLIVDTCGGMTDSEHFYETAVSHPSYNRGNWIIVESYDDEYSARTGHKRWVEAMTSNHLPKFLKCVSTSNVSKEKDKVYGNDLHRIYPKSSFHRPSEGGDEDPLLGGDVSQL